MERPKECRAQSGRAGAAGPLSVALWTAQMAWRELLRDLSLESSGRRGMPTGSGGVVVVNSSDSRIGDFSRTMLLCRRWSMKYFSLSGWTIRPAQRDACRQVSARLTAPARVRWMKRRSSGAVWGIGTSHGGVMPVCAAPPPPPTQRQRASA